MLKVRTTRSRFLSVISGLLSAVFIVLSVFGAVDTSDKKSSAVDPIRWIMCNMWGDQSLPSYIYLGTQSDALAYTVLSKSALNSSDKDDVRTGLNGILTVVGFNFEKANEQILGHSLDPSTGVDTDSKKNGSNAQKTIEEAKKNYNKGPQLNFFDRFGVAGLNFSGYAGEWKYLAVQVCQDVDPIDTRSNIFYEGRLDPKSTFEDVGNSQDIRSLQFGGFGKNFLINSADNIANWIFNIVKLMVVLTVVLIGFSFSDITSVMGINDLLANNSNGGIFGALYNSFFTPLIVLAIAGTGVRIGYLGIVKREFRGAFNVLFRTIALFFAAVAFSVWPGTLIGLPNTITTYVQSIVLTSVNSGLSSNGSQGLCTTYSGDLITDTGNPQSDLEKAGKNMQSAVGCQFWYNYLLRPWAKGQFGVEWNQLFANGKTPDWAPAGSSEIKSDKKNEVFVAGDKPLGGLAAVPLGNGKYVNNWALLQISTQTNAHGPITQEGQWAKYYNGSAEDWWRIVDVLSNYTESTKTESVGGSGSGANVNDEVSYVLPDAANPLPEWNDWTGNTAYNRIGIALLALVVGGIGLAGPLIFSLFTAVTAFGTAFLLTIAPIMFLFGCWGDKGWNIFKGWGEMVLNTIFKRIGFGLLLALSISITITILNMFTQIGWAQGVLLLMIASLLLIASRREIVDIFKVSFSNGAFRGSTDKFTSGIKRFGSTVGSVGGSAAAGGISAKKYGGGFLQGAASGVKTDLKNKLYMSRVGREAMSIYQTTKGFDEEDLSQNTCAICGKKLTDQNISGYGDNIVGLMEDGSYCCKECLDDDRAPNAVEVMFNEKKPEKTESVYSGEEAKKALNDLRRISSKNKEGKISEEDRRRVVSNVSRLAATAAAEVNSYTFNKGSTPDIPDELRPYIKENLLNVAWENLGEGKDDPATAAMFIQEYYSEAFYAWAVDQFAEQFIQELDPTSSRDDDQSAHSLFKAMVNEKTPYSPDK